MHSKETIDTVGAVNPMTRRESSLDVHSGQAAQKEAVVSEQETVYEFHFAPKCEVTGDTAAEIAASAEEVAAYLAALATEPEIEAEPDGNQGMIYRTSNRRVAARFNFPDMCVGDAEEPKDPEYTHDDRRPVYGNTRLPMRVTNEEMLAAVTSVVQIIRYETEHTPIPQNYDAEGKARSILAAPDSPEKRAVMRWARRIARKNIAEKAAEASGLYSPCGLYAALCDLSEHIMYVQGKTKYRMPAVFMTSDDARRSATDIIRVIRRVTGFDLMDPVASLRRMQEKAH
jgi:hypothetical protein